MRGRGRARALYPTVSSQRRPRREVARLERDSFFAWLDAVLVVNQAAGMQDVQQEHSDGDGHPVEPIEERLLGDDLAVPPVGELDGTVDRPVGGAETRQPVKRNVWP